MKVLVLGTCRSGSFQLPIQKVLVPHFQASYGGASLQYDYRGVEIHTSPINYTAKLADVVDTMKYMRGELYADKDPNTDETFFKLFFRGHRQGAFKEKKLKKPGEIISGDDNEYDFYIFEMCSLKEYRFNTDKYGPEYVGKNLPWKPDVDKFNTLPFRSEEFGTITYTEEQAHGAFSELSRLTRGKPILVIGPYLYNDDKHAVVNEVRRGVQRVLKEQCAHFPAMEYFDMSDDIVGATLLEDDHHFNKQGCAVIHERLTHWIAGKAGLPLVSVKPKRKIVVLATTAGTIGRIHRDLETALLDEYEFLYHQAAYFYWDSFKQDFKEADICLTTLNLYNDVKEWFKTPQERNKITFMCYGENDIRSTQPYSTEFSYGVICAEIASRLPVPSFVVPIGVNSDRFEYTERDGRITTLGVADIVEIPMKQVEWAHKLASRAGLPLSIASGLSLDKLNVWYKTIDVYVTTEPDPITLLEAAVSGALVIGPPTGKFRGVPGPKSTTIEEGVALLNELKLNPTRVKQLAKEQCEFVKAHHTYRALLHNWRALFDSVIERHSASTLTSPR